MKKTFEQIRAQVFSLDDEQLVEYFRRYSIQEENRRQQYEATDPRYADHAKVFDILRSELIRRLNSKTK